MDQLQDIEQRLDRMYAELGELRRLLIQSVGPRKTRNEDAWQQFLAASEQVSELWTGPDAVEEIRAQRE